MVDPIQSAAVSLDDFLIDRLPALAAMPPTRQFRILRQYSHAWLLPYDVVVKRYLRLLNPAPLPPPRARRRFKLPRLPVPTWKWLEQVVSWLAWLSDVLHHRPTLEESCQIAELRAQIYSNHSGAV